MNLFLIKAKAFPEGTIRTWKGVDYKKIGNKWLRVPQGTKKGGVKKVADKKRAIMRRGAEKYFNYSMTTNMGNLVEETLDELKIKDFGGLVNRIQKSDFAESHRIFKKLVDKVRDAPGKTEDKKAVIDFFGTALLKLRGVYATKPKVKTTIKKTGAGTKDPAKEKSGLPAIKASALSRAKKKLGGWNVTEPLSNTNIRNMIKNKQAKLISGKIQSKLKWEMPNKINDIGVKYTGNSITLQVTQSRLGKTGQRRNVLSRVEITIPHEYAKAFLQSQIKEKRVRSNAIFRLEHSKGYREVIKKVAA